MAITYSGTFQDLFVAIAFDLTHQPVINRAEWQSMDVSQSTAHATRELPNTIVQWPVPADVLELQSYVHPDLPWAENHFLERVSGIPHNPPPSHVDWPWAKRNNGDHTGDTGTFSHTYPERFWPKHAGLGNTPCPPVFPGNHHKGIRFAYGDLTDVVQLLRESPMTRQAYLPVWFPEDTGGHVRLGERVPCTLGYHFMMRPNWTLDINYFMRSCDMVRHFHNDVYMAARLLQWIIAALSDEQVVKPGLLTMFVSSMHVMQGDLAALNTAMAP